MAKDKELSTNDEVQRGKDFQKKVNVKEDVFNTVKELLDSTSEDAFKTAGYDRNKKIAGVYGDGTTYGTGVESGKINIKIAGKTKSSLQKELIFGVKTLISVINIEYKESTVIIEYKSPEAGFFRGVETKGERFGKGFTISETMTIPTNDMAAFKNKVKAAFTEFAKKEVEFMADTKIGVEDKVERGTTSLGESVKSELNMKRLTISELFSEDLELHNRKIQGLNTVNLNDKGKATFSPETPAEQNNKTMFFDELGEGDDELNVNDLTGAPGASHWKDIISGEIGAISQLTNGKLKLIQVNTDGEEPSADVDINGKTYQINMIDDDKYFIVAYPNNNSSVMNQGVPGFTGTAGDIVSMINAGQNALKNFPGTTFSANENAAPIDEITTAGPALADTPGGFKDGAQSGAGGYNTPYAFKKTPYGQRQNSKRPKITKDYNIIPEKKEGRKFWTEVELNPGSGYVPKGMEHNTIVGLHDADAAYMKKLGYSEKENQVGYMKDGKVADSKKSWTKNPINENTKPATDKAPVANNPHEKKPDLTQKKFFSENENKEKGVNKRYLITEKTTSEYENERWKKLSQFKTYETIKEAEEMNTFFDSLKENANKPLGKKIITENIEEPKAVDLDALAIAERAKLNESKEETVDVEKPGSKFGLMYKFFRNDFLNENKKYILDLNSRVFVPNPNAK